MNELKQSVFCKLEYPAIKIIKSRHLGKCKQNCETVSLGKI